MIFLTVIIIFKIVVVSDWVVALTVLFLIVLDRLPSKEYPLSELVAFMRESGLSSADNASC